ncbi:MAG: M43 family zinc metalloprotease, partial [Flavobacteriales bacterium]
MKKTFILLLALVSSFAGFAQLKCGSDHKHQLLRQQDPDFVQREADFNRLVDEYIAAHRGERDEVQLTIPIVFHIIHQWGEENISDEQIFDAVRILNEDYNKDNADTTLIVHDFDTICADVKIKFCLPTKDFEGNCTNGIDRIASPETFIGDDGSKLNAWPRDRYLNVWVVSSMEDGVAGYAYYPSAVSGGIGAMRDGVIILHQYIGSIGTGQPGRSRALTHEVGHWLNLQHPWGDNNNPGVVCGDDDVTDTPETMGWDFCDLNGAICNPGVFENVQNFMDYSYCSVMFTEGQKERIRAAAAQALAGRSTLWSESNLIFTGCDGSVAECAPIPNFYADRFVVCVGDEVTFINNTGGGVATSYNWTFQDGVTSTDEDPTIVFNTPGWKTVTLVASNEYGSESKTIIKSVFVSPNPNWYNGLQFENFQNTAFVNENYISRNMDSNSSFFQVANNVGYDDNKSYMLNAYDIDQSFIDTGNNDIDEFVTPAFNLDDLMGSATFTYKYAYATQATTVEGITDRLEIYSSANCGATWQQRDVITGTELVTAGVYGNSFVPTSQSDWAQGSFNIPNTLFNDDILFRFIFKTGDYPNNFYIDNINIQGTVGVDELNGELTALNVYPNPANDNATVA